jgi:hypothetical protein
MVRNQNTIHHYKKFFILQRYASDDVISSLDDPFYDVFSSEILPSDGKKECCKERHSASTIPSNNDIFYIITPDL